MIMGSKIRETFLNKVVWPFLVLALTPTVTLIGSKVQSGDWLTWLKAIPSWIYTAFFGTIAFWVIIGFIVRRVHHLRQRNLPSIPSIFTIPRWGYVTVGTLTYKDVTWRVQVTAPPPWEVLSLSTAREKNVSIETPPRCPKCDTELEEAETFFGNYRWTCVRCDYSTKNNMSYYHESVRAEKLAQSWWEKEPK